MQLMQWFCFGILFTLMVQGLAYLSIKVSLAWWVWGGFIISCLAIMFGVAWAGASFLEGVEQSAAMGLISFAGPGVLIIEYLWKTHVNPQLQ